MTGPVIVPPGIAAKTLDRELTRESVYSLHFGMICPKPSSSSDLVLLLIPADTLCRNDAPSQTLGNRMVSDNDSKCFPANCFHMQVLEKIPKVLLLVIPLLSIHLRSRILSVFLVPFLPLTNWIVQHPVRNRSVNTELIYRMNDSEQELVFEASAFVVYGVSVILLFLDSTSQSTDTPVYWMTGIVESLHHLSGCRVPFLSGIQGRVPYHFFPSPGHLFA